MTDQQQPTCTCTVDGYSPECPEAFVQGGKILHTIQNETKLKPRQYGMIEGPASRVTETTQGYDRPSSDGSQSMSSMDNYVNVFKYQDRVQEGEPMTVEPLSIVKPTQGSDQDHKYISSEGLRMGLDNSLNKFNALTIGGVTLTEATIGGYRLDVATLSKKAAEVIPLPPIALPLVFRDTDLNFSHHFFQGLEIIAGRVFIVGLANTRKYHASDKSVFCPLVKGLISMGYQAGDSDLVVFVKRVLSVTFSIDESQGRPAADDVLLVASNFYGFQYIEGGMQCKEADLKMWLQSAYTQYRLSWFNAFKSSGIPDFALEGVQDRYATVESYQEPSRSVARAPAMHEANYHDHEARHSSRRSHRSKTYHEYTPAEKNGRMHGFFK
jgi:hypothetical protein